MASCRRPRFQSVTDFYPQTRTRHGL
jgi:hypothetical protein